jgi:hypothetical protein
LRWSTHSETDVRASAKSRNANSPRGYEGTCVADPNRELFENVVHLLRPVLDEFVFLGGCTTGLLITDPAASGIRPTNDVDAIVDVAFWQSG